MIVSNERHELRQFYFDAWQKYLDKEKLEPLQQQVVQIIIAHPEYHYFFEQPDKYLHQDYVVENNMTNPFLHLGLHIGLQEQISTDRPKGIRELYSTLVKKYQGDYHHVEHLMLEKLGEFLWQMQQRTSIVSENDYMEALKQL